VFEELRSGGFTGASLWVMTQNTAAQAFYEKAGWEADGAETDHCLGITIPAVRYRRAL
jgi:ribosomal protein S18 acetylase RimI-like enzyme